MITCLHYQISPLLRIIMLLLLLASKVFHLFLSIRCCIICGNFYAKIKDLVDLFKKEKAVLISESVHLDNLIKNLLTDNIIIKDTGYNAKKITTRFQNPEKYLYNKIRYLIENNENSRILV